MPLEQRFNFKEGGAEGGAETEHIAALGLVPVHLINQDYEEGKKCSMLYVYGTREGIPVLGVRGQPRVASIHAELIRMFSDSVTFAKAALARMGEEGDEFLKPASLGLPEAQVYQDQRGVRHSEQSMVRPLDRGLHAGVRRALLSLEPRNGRLRARFAYGRPHRARPQGVRLISTDGSQSPALGFLRIILRRNQIREDREGNEDRREDREGRECLECRECHFTLPQRLLEGQEGQESREFDLKWATESLVEKPLA